MTRKTVLLVPEMEQMLINVGTRIRKARLRRNIKAEFLADRVGISNGTLHAIEKGAPTVSFVAYAAVLYALNMEREMFEEGK